MRSAVAKQHGLDERLVGQLSATDPDLTDAQIAAIDFATALMTDPAGISAELRAALALAVYLSAILIILIRLLMNLSHRIKRLYGIFIFRIRWSRQ